MLTRIPTTNTSMPQAACFMRERIGKHNATRSVMRFSNERHRIGTISDSTTPSVHPRHRVHINPHIEGCSINELQGFAIADPDMSRRSNTAKLCSGAPVLARYVAHAPGRSYSPEAGKACLIKANGEHRSGQGNCTTVSICNRPMHWLIQAITAMRASGQRAVPGSRDSRMPACA